MSFPALFPLLCLVLPVGLAALAADAPMLDLSLRRRKAVSPDSTEVQQTLETSQWDARRTAIIVCDMWDKHWCASASRRVNELAPRMNYVLNAARNRGVVIVHAPSDTMPFYANTPQRERAMNAPASPAPDDICDWQPLDPACESPLPVDDTDNGCDDLPQCPIYTAWTRQHPAIEIAAQDAITDNGAEVFNLLAQYQIDNVIVLGVHTNMCVLGRSFGIRRLVRLGKNVALMRDMTDCLYNPRRAPYVTHYRGTELIIAHIETHWCPTLTSDQIAGGQPFRFSDDQEDSRP
jgi:nicotinamidase-related amidase